MPLPAATIGLIASGIGALPSIFDLFKGKKTRGPYERIGYESTSLGQQMRNQLGDINARDKNSWNRFSGLAASATPSISDLIGANYSQGGTGQIGRAQQQAARQQGLAGVSNAYSNYRDMLNQQRMGVYSQLAGYEGQLNDQNLRWLDQGISRDRLDKEYGIGQGLLGAGMGILGQRFADSDGRNQQGYNYQREYQAPTGTPVNNNIGTLGANFQDTDPFGTSYTSDNIMGGYGQGMQFGKNNRFGTTFGGPGMMGNRFG